jgi:hypothetical protein
MAAQSMVAMAVIPDIHRTLTKVAITAAMPAPSAAAPMRTQRAFASNVAPPCRPANVPPAARNWPQAPSSVVNAEIRNLNAVYIPHFTQWGSTSSIMAEKLEKDLLLDLKAGWFAEHHSLIFAALPGMAGIGAGLPLLLMPALA